MTIHIGQKQYSIIEYRSLNVTTYMVLVIFVVGINAKNLELQNFKLGTKITFFCFNTISYGNAIFIVSDERNFSVSHTAVLLSNMRADEHTDFIFSDDTKSVTLNLGHT